MEASAGSYSEEERGHWQPVDRVKHVLLYSECYKENGFKGGKSRGQGTSWWAIAIVQVANIDVLV